MREADIHLFDIIIGNMGAHQSKGAIAMSNWLKDEQGQFSPLLVVAILLLLIFCCLGGQCIAGIINPPKKDVPKPDWAEPPVKDELEPDPNADCTVPPETTTQPEPTAPDDSAPPVEEGLTELELSLMEGDVIAQEKGLLVRSQTVQAEDGTCFSLVTQWHDQEMLVVVLTTAQVKKVMSMGEEFIAEDIPESEFLVNIEEYEGSRYEFRIANGQEDQVLTIVYLR